jgi:hypothetical protein
MTLRKINAAKRRPANKAACPVAEEKGTEPE